MQPQYADGAAEYRAAYLRGLTPDPELWIDEWADHYQRIPRDTGAAEPGKYHTSRTPFAREPMRCMSPQHPCRRVVTMVASQMMKTQIALNWIGGNIHMAPANILTLLPSEKLAKRVSSRIDKTIKAVPELAKRVAKPNSRDARNTIDTKEFEGGTLYCTTAGSASNLAELAARYVYGDEIDRWDSSVDSEGDPIELAEARGTTFGRKAKFYFSSSPTLKGVSRIADLYESSDQRQYLVPCPHCGEHQPLVWENLDYSADYRRAEYRCSHCAAMIAEHHKTAMLAAGRWEATAAGDGETAGFHLNALYSPLGWLSWASLGKQYDKARAAMDKGDPEPMQVFYNTRLALVWDATTEQTSASELKARAEGYRLGDVPTGALILTAAVDVQHNRLEFMVLGWGEDLERWIVDVQVIPGDPSDPRTWALLDERLQHRYRHTSGVELAICATAIDSGGHHTHEVYQFTRLRRWRNVIAIKGASRPGRLVLAQRPSKVDINRQGKVDAQGAELWLVGTDTAKSWVYDNYTRHEGPGALHFSADLPDDFYEQCVAERKLTRYVNGHKKTQWVKSKAERNEALDLLVYNLAAAHFVGLHRYRPADWAKLRQQVSQGSLFADSPARAATQVPPAEHQPASPVPPAPPAPQPAPRRVNHSGYLSRRR